MKYRDVSAKNVILMMRYLEYADLPLSGLERILKVDFGETSRTVKTFLLDGKVKEVSSKDSYLYREATSSEISVLYGFMREEMRKQAVEALIDLQLKDFEGKI